MGQPVTLHSYYAGMARDSSRDQLPPGFLWNLQDFIPNYLGAPLRKRGGWTLASSSMSANGSSSMQRILYNQQASTGKMWAIDSASSTTAGPTIWSVNLSTGAVSAVASITAGSAASAGPSTNGYAGIGAPAYLNNKFIIPVGSTGKSQTWAVPLLFTGDAPTYVLGLSADETGWKYAEVYKDRVVIANSGGNSRRIRFSAAGDGEDFTDTASWIDIPNEVLGLASLPNVLLIFTVRGTFRIRGSIPPNTAAADDDMVLDKLNDIGCRDQRSVVAWQGKVIWADTLGVYITDGFATQSLTDAGFMGGYYRSLTSVLNDVMELNGGVYRDFYFLSISNAPGGSFTDCLVCDLRRRTWFRLQNFNFRGFIEAKDGSYQKYFAACATSARAANISDIFNPGSANKNDGDGTPVLPVVEYPATRGFRQLRRKWITNEGLSHWKRVYLTHDHRDAATDDPVLTISYVATPEATSYTAITPTLAETTTQKRSARSFGPTGTRGGKIVSTMAFKIAQTNPSSDTRLYTLQGEYEALEEGRLAQT